MGLEFAVSGFRVGGFGVRFHGLQQLVSCKFLSFLYSPLAEKFGFCSLSWGARSGS